MWKLLLAAVAGYLLGNVQTAILLSKWKYKDDVRKHGSGNAGSTNMLRVFGLKSGLVTFVGDFLKGIIGVIVGRLIAGENGAYIASLFVVLGHDFPAFLQFRGGKGVASTLAILWMLNPLYGAIVTAVAVIMLFATRIVSVASLSGTTAYVILALVFSNDNLPFVALSITLWLLVVIRHADNIKRLLHKQESRLFEKNKKDAGH
ncbi:glycerol-3-phosphate 1-O-acyltransferase PlsY [Christensenellaceae bacterium OttesenSCG-928-L17]|nr:glycerol-3-phosphate 1-O-acyltransferase PlsY [Christensenellaceae bacterium OttesenSCG-928-L17]